MGQKKIAESPKRENESVFQRSTNLAAEEREKKRYFNPGRVIILMRIAATALLKIIRIDDGIIYTRFALMLGFYVGFISSFRIIRWNL